MKMKSVIGVQSAAIRIVDTSCSSGSAYLQGGGGDSPNTSDCAVSLQHCSTAEWQV